MKYKNYYNFELGNRDIYSHNDILGMTVQDLFDNELPLSYQYNTIGIPKDDELINSPNTMQYTNANGKRRWRSSSKTTEDLIEEERQRRAALEAQNQAAQSQLSSIQPQSAPIANNVQKNVTPSPINDSQSFLDNSTISAITGFAGKMINKFKNRKQQSGGVIADAIDSAVNNEDDLQQQSPIIRGIENSNNPNFPIMEKGSENPFEPQTQLDDLISNVEQPEMMSYGLYNDPMLDILRSSIEAEISKGSENPFDQQTQQDDLRIEPTDIPEVEGLSSDKLAQIKAKVAAQYKQALSRAKRNRAAVYPENGVLDGSVRYNLKDYLRDSLGNLAKSFNVKEKWRNFQDTGFNKEDDLNLREEAQGYLHDNSKLYRNYEGLTPIEAAQKAASKLPLSLAAREYYGISTELNDEGKPTKKYMKNNDFYKLDDIHNEETRRLIQKNMIQNLELDPNDPATYEKIKDIDVVIPKQNSHLHNLVKNSDELAEFVAKNYEGLKANPGKRLDSSIVYKKPSWQKNHRRELLDELNLYAIYKKSDISAKVNPDGSMTIIHPDFYDFGHMDPNQENGPINKGIAMANNIAESQQKKNQLKKYSLTNLFTLSPEEVQELLEKQRRKK